MEGIGVPGSRHRLLMALPVSLTAACIIAAEKYDDDTPLPASNGWCPGPPYHLEAPEWPKTPEHPWKYPPYAYKSPHHRHLLMLISLHLHHHIHHRLHTFTNHLPRMCTSLLFRHHLHHLPHKSTSLLPCHHHPHLPHISTNLLLHPLLTFIPSTASATTIVSLTCQMLSLQ